ncbi:MAG: response regulator [Thermotogae bacterium]|nr:response regulator [Thermotogota bacterium]MCP5465710.1 response regulator [Thermotogota bacterium]
MKKILVVDDSDVLRKIIVFNLKTSGYEVHEAVNGEEGLKKIKELNPAIVILDIMMPIMDGFAVLANLQKESINIPVIVLTAKGGDSDEENATKLGASKVLTKPFSPKQLVENVKELLGE